MSEYDNKALIDITITVANGGEYEYGDGNDVAYLVRLPLEDCEIEELIKSLETERYNRELENFELYIIEDYAASIPFDMSEFVESGDIVKLNNRVKEVCELDDDEYDILEGLSEFGYSYDKAMEIIRSGSYSLYYNCENMEDVAMVVVDEYYEVPEFIKNYIDYSELANDLEHNGSRWLALNNRKYVEIL